ncbi:hypothetical protein LNV08_13170 [Paucibacter sp. TC2R-5]|uniref:hypothetical protein n=1 Tax=Paucibacter sp. TC2R-5 TaxID=2893555 RepID=UPI0021E41E68|nr:hypothetical protein [Paucibacter sp. TC2R-5]MCV2359922.1 hypothetical protein [Paucibacter sp. TC2R-5]
MNPHGPRTQTDADLPQQLWQAQAVAALDIDVEALREQSRHLQGQIARRNRREYMAGYLFVIPAFMFYAWFFPSWLIKLGALLTILATLLVMQQLRRRAGSRQLPATAMGQSWLDFQRAELLRQRAALRSVWLWYIGPFVPGFVLFVWGIERELADPAMATAFALFRAGGLVLALSIIALNLRTARRYERDIEALERQFTASA